MRTLLPCAIAFGLLGASLGLCQIVIKKSEITPRGPAGPIQIYQVFFERVVRSNPRGPFIFQFDLTGAEVAIVNNVAADCESKLEPLSDNPVVWEARMRSLESGEEQEDWRNQRLAELKARRDRVIGEHVEALRASLGEPRFQALETLIQDWYIASGPGTSPGKK
jgi:hypothetical protein